MRLENVELTSHLDDALKKSIKRVIYFIILGQGLIYNFLKLQLIKQKYFIIIFIAQIRFNIFGLIVIYFGLIVIY
jgi:hypothetical protein